MPYGNNGYQKPANSGTTTKKNNKDSTSGVRLTNYDAMRYLTVNYWKRTASVDIGPVPQGATRATTVWDWNESKPTVHLAMSFTSLTTLEAICDEVWDSIKKNGSFANVGAPCGAELNHLIEINNGSTIGQPDGIYIVIYKDRDTATGRANSYDYYPCSARLIERNYDRNTGASTKDYSKVQDFKDFRRCIHEAVSALTMAYAHTVQEVQASDTSSMLEAMAAICAHNGITLQNSSSTASRSAGSSKSSGGSSGYQRGNWQNRSRGGYGGNSYGNNGYPKKSYGGGYQNNSYGDNPPWKQSAPQQQQQDNEMSMTMNDLNGFDVLV